jgi:hypothetical protein
MNIKDENDMQPLASPRPGPTDNDLKMVGQIILNWATTDHILGRVLEDVIYNLRGGEAVRAVGADLIYGTNMRRKLDLNKRHRRERLPDDKEIDTIISGLTSAIEKEKCSGI